MEIKVYDVADKIQEARLLLVHTHRMNEEDLVKIAWQDRVVRKRPGRSDGRIASKVNLRVASYR